MKHLTRFFALSLVLATAGSFGFYQTSHATTSLGVGANVNISKLAGNQTETAIAVNPSNPNSLVAVSNVPGANGIFKAYSLDGGTTWTSDIIADGDALGTACCDPSVSGCYDSFGNFFLTYLSSGGTGFMTQTALSTDGGVTFTFLATLASSTDQPSIVQGAASVWVTYTNSSNQIAARGAAVTGLGTVGAFSAEQTVPGSSGDFGDIAIGPSGQVMVVYQNNGSGEGPDTIRASVDPDGLGPMGFGAQISVTATNVGGFDTIPAQPQRTVDAESGLAWDRTGGTHNGRVYLVYTDETPDESNNTDIFVRFSDNNGSTWSAPVKVNDDATTRSQFLPRVALDQTSGNIAVSWYDCRNSAGNNTAQIFATVSDTSGVSFLPNVAVSGGTSNANAAAVGSFDFGDYAGLSFQNGAFFASWGDNSNSTGDNPDGTLNQLDVYTARVAYCMITCPGNITQSTDPGQCTAVVNYPAPTTSGSCGTVTCMPASASTFPKGTTTVTCTSTTGANCSFTVTVNDTEPPHITCPANITAVTNQTVCVPASQACQVVNFTTTATDNCPGVTVVCNPPSGSCIPVGTTTVTCTATDTSMNTATCSFTIKVFDVCLQDDSNPATVLLFNSLTGEYRFCCGGTIFTGTGTVMIKGCTITLQHNPGDRRLQANVDKTQFKGNAALQFPPGVMKCTIMDRDTRNNSCVCP